MPIYKFKSREFRTIEGAIRCKDLQYHTNALFKLLNELGSNKEERIKIAYQLLKDKIYKDKKFMLNGNKLEKILRVAKDNQFFSKQIRLILYQDPNDLKSFKLRFSMGETTHEMNLYGEKAGYNVCNIHEGISSILKNLERDLK